MYRFLERRGAAAAMSISVLIYGASFFLPFDSLYLAYSGAGRTPIVELEPGAPEGQWNPFPGWAVFLLARKFEYCWQQCVLYWAATILLGSAWIMALLSRWKWVAALSGTALVTGIV